MFVEAIYNDLRGAGKIRADGFQIDLAVAFAWGPMLTAVPASAQVDLTGSGASRMHEDWFERGPGWDLGDYTGAPLNDEARAIALLYEPTLLAMRERQCLPYSPYAWPYQPGGFRMWSEFERKTAASSRGRPPSEPSATC